MLFSGLLISKEEPAASPDIGLVNARVDKRDKPTPKVRSFILESVPR